MGTRLFSQWFSTFRNSINNYDYYTDFDKVYENAKDKKIEINLLGSLVRSNDIEGDFKNLISKYPECLKAIPILLAVRDNHIYCQDLDGAIDYKFDKKVQSIEQYTYFMSQTGLFKMLQKHIIGNLYDYVTGIEVGLDSNGRKNRGGQQMESLVESYLKKAKIPYHAQMYLEDIEKRWNINLSPISSRGTSTKRWDFVVKNGDYVYAIETNFYTSGGSKLNEVARSYKMIAEESKNIQGFKFVWITDGGGWQKAQNNLKETFEILPNLYNIFDMENGLFNDLFNQI